MRHVIVILLPKYCRFRLIVCALGHIFRPVHIWLLIMHFYDSFRLFDHKSNLIILYFHAYRPELLHQDFSF
ncbi:hypothetical protein D3C84_549930 [compost metagenome]